MKKLLMVCISILILTSCEDVIEVDLNEAPPRLVVEASINILENGASFNSFIKLTTTAPFFDNEIPVVEDASIQIKDEDGMIYPFEHIGSGRYDGLFFPIHNMEYTLEILYKGETYIGSTQFESTVPLEYVEQRDDGGFSGEDIELKVFFTDPVGEGNYYFFKGNSERGLVLDVLSDEFFDGNSIFGYYLVEDLAKGDQVQFNLYGIDEAFYNYMFILLQQTGGGGGPFETQPATVRGNIVNKTNPENYPLGYFRISELSTLSYTVQ
ncbi:MAG TPA: DUF4249 domain-containing protein [Aequorivita sp.]|nr:DUF4249 domain-containing protein [Aequorivita sp.]